MGPRRYGFLAQDLERLLPDVPGSGGDCFARGLGLLPTRIRGPLGPPKTSLCVVMVISVCNHVKRF